MRLSLLSFLLWITTWLLLIINWPFWLHANNFRTNSIKICFLSCVFSVKCRIRPNVCSMKCRIRSNVCSMKCRIRSIVCSMKCRIQSIVFRSNVVHRVKTTPPSYPRHPASRELSRDTRQRHSLHRDVTQINTFENTIKYIFIGFFYYQSKFNCRSLHGDQRIKCCFQCKPA